MKKINGKALLQSKVFWFNLLAGIIAIASLFGFGDFQPDSKTTEVISTVVAIVNIALRLYTGQPITKFK